MHQHIIYRWFRLKNGRFHRVANGMPFADGQLTSDPNVEVNEILKARLAHPVFVDVFHPWNTKVQGL